MLTNIFQSAEGGMLPSLSNVDLFLGMAYFWDDNDNDHLNNWMDYHALMVHRR